MIRSSVRGGVITLGRAGAVALAATLIAACAPRAARLTVRPAASRPPAEATATARSSASASPAARPTARAMPLGVAGSFRAGERQFTVTEPAHTGPAGQPLGPRKLVIQLWYPRAARAAGAAPAAGPFPLLLFAPGFQQCAAPYADLLTAWAGAGYVVAAVNFPRTDCRVAATANEADLVNQPGDMSYVLSRLLALSARPAGPLSGLLNSRQIAAAGHSDGGDAVAALAASTCCADHRLAAVAVLSGAEWHPMPGRYFADGAPPMLFTQGSADVINPPWTSVQLYDADTERARYYLDLFGADHTRPYWGANPVERIVARVTLAFFDCYVLHQSAALTAMTRDGDVSGVAELVSGGRPVP